MNPEILSGNEIIIQGGLEAGFDLYTGYPGSPLADYFNILNAKKDELHKVGIRVVIGNSEANAAAMASGAKQAGKNVCIAMKSMGLHVAADALSVGNFSDPGPKMADPNTGELIGAGVVVVVGDDPWSISTSIPADSRYLFKHLHIPFLEPSTPQELKDWMETSLYISRRSGIYQGLLLTTFMAEGGGRVNTKARAKISSQLTHLNPETFDLGKNVMVPPNSLKADYSMINERFPKVLNILKELKLDKAFGDPEAKLGIISAGVIFETLKQVLEEWPFNIDYYLYKVASSYPLVEDLLVPYLEKLKFLIVVEEKRGFLETEITRLIQKKGLSIKVFGKKFQENEGFPSAGGLNYEIIQQKLNEVFSIIYPDTFKECLNPLKLWDKKLPLRLPTFCPGCPHRETLSLLKDIRKTLSKKGIELISHGDVGCYSLSFLPPFKEMHNLSAMGQGGALGAGLDMFTTNPSVVLMGDSTFFHSGITDISNSVQIGHNITYILLDNDNTAMTGHQMTPVTGQNVEGDKRPRQEIKPIVENLGVQDVLEVNPSDRYFYRSVILDYVKRPGTKVIVSNKECALTFHGKIKKQERELFSKDKTVTQKRFYQINTDVCEDCRECVEMTGCPALNQTQGAYGPKITINPQICVGDSYCTKLKACPSFELVDVLNYHPTLYKGQKKDLQLDSLPLPKIINTFERISSGKDWRIVVTGVGGSGITTISRVLAEAAKKMGGRHDLEFKFVEQKGLAQRNGRVTNHLAFFKKGQSSGTITPLKTADLLLSLDLLDGASQINFLSTQGKAIFDGDFQTPLSILLDYGEEGSPPDAESIQQWLKKQLNHQVHFFDFKNICKEIVGKSFYASAMILGSAFQAGLLPFSIDDLKQALKDVFHPKEFANNWTAFQLGRKAYLQGEEGLVEKESKDVKSKRHLSFLKQSIAQSLLPWQNRNSILSFFNKTVLALQKIFPEIEKNWLAQYVHDLIIFDRGKKINSYIEDAKMLNNLYPALEEKKLAIIKKDISTDLPLTLWEETSNLIFPLKNGC
jgi:indolepyruvate ferredoxin oxidoreductase